MITLNKMEKLNLDVEIIEDEDYRTRLIIDENDNLIERKLCTRCKTYHPIVVKKCRFCGCVKLSIEKVYELHALYEYKDMSVVYSGSQKTFEKLSKVFNFDSKSNPIIIR